MSLVATSYRGLLLLLLLHIRITEVPTLRSVTSLMTQQGCSHTRRPLQLGKEVKLTSLVVFMLRTDSWTYSSLSGDNVTPMVSMKDIVPFPFLRPPVSSAWVMWASCSDVRPLYQKKKVYARHCQATWFHQGCTLAQSIYKVLWQAEVLR